MYILQGRLHHYEIWKLPKKRSTSLERFTSQCGTGNWKSQHSREVTLLLPRDAWRPETGIALQIRPTAWYIWMSICLQDVFLQGHCQLPILAPKNPREPCLFMPLAITHSMYRVGFALAKMCSCICCTSSKQNHFGATSSKTEASRCFSCLCWCIEEGPLLQLGRESTYSSHS